MMGYTYVLFLQCFKLGDLTPSKDPNSFDGENDH